MKKGRIFDMYNSHAEMRMVGHMCWAFLSTQLSVITTPTNQNSMQLFYDTGQQEVQNSMKYRPSDYMLQITYITGL